MYLALAELGGISLLLYLFSLVLRDHTPFAVYL